MTPILDLTVDWESLLESPAREALEATILPPFLRVQRWFGGKARGLKAVRISDWAPLPTSGAVAFLVLLEVELSDGAADLYFAPLGITAGAAWPPSKSDHVLARLRGPGGEATLHDALADEAADDALLEAIERGKEFAMKSGRICAFPTAAYAELRGQTKESLPAVLKTATSSNSLVLYGQHLMMKLFRRLEIGVNPDFEIGRFLTEKSRFDRIPKAAGAMEYHRPGCAPVTLAFLQELVAHQGDGWTHALDALTHFFGKAAQRKDDAPLHERSLLEIADSDPTPAAVETVGTFLGSAATLGRRTAELHLALADGGGNPDFTPEALTPADWKALAADTREQARLALPALRAVHPQGDVSALEGLLTSLQVKPLTLDAGKIRCHGDYHLGQVLWVDDDFVILDFEGEPTRTIDERRAKQSPLKDVAGMLRSFDYAAYAGLFAFTQDRPNDFTGLAPWAELWRRGVSAAFLRSYRATAANAAFLPDNPEAFSALLDAFVLNKAFYELVYELNNRPDWVRIPLQGILALAGRGAAGQAPTKG